MKTKLYPFQERAKEFHLDHHYSLNLCEMGLGKTLMALAVASEVGGETLILCPAFLKENWRREIKNHIGSNVGFKVMSYSVLSKGKLDKSWKATTIIADEVHYLKNPQAIRTKTALKMLMKLKPKYFIGLTGTPVKNRIPEFYSLLSMVSLNPLRTSGIDVNKYFPVFNKFAQRYCHEKQNVWSGGKDYYGFKPNRVSEFKTLLRHKIFKVSGDDVLNLPPLFHKKFFAKCSVPKDLAREFEDFEGGAGSEGKKLSAITKVDSTIEYVNNILDQGNGPVVVFSDHVLSANKLAKELKTTAITGSTPMFERTKIYDRFVSRQIKVLVATIGAFSVGVNLTNCSHLVFNDVSWVPGDNAQAMKRIHRIGQQKPCTIHYVLGGFVDEGILDKIRDKMEVINKANDLALGLTDEIR